MFILINGNIQCELEINWKTDKSKGKQEQK